MNLYDLTEKNRKSPWKTFNPNAIGNLINWRNNDGNLVKERLK